MPWLGAETSLLTCLSEAHGCGYRGIELGSQFPRLASVLAPMLAEHSLELASGWHSMNLLSQSLEDEIRNIQPHLNLLAELQAEVVIVAETSNATHGNPHVPLSQRPRLLASQWDVYGESLSALAIHCRQFGLALAYHYHIGTVVQSEQDIDRLVQATDDEVGLLLDTGHAEFAGVNTLSVVEKYGRRIKHVHCKDVRAQVLADVKNRDLSFLSSVLLGVFTVPGDGCVDFGSILSALYEQDYDGWFVVEAEQDPAVAPSEKYAQTGIEQLSKLCVDAGYQ